MTQRFVSKGIPAVLTLTAGLIINAACSQPLAPSATVAPPAGAIVATGPASTTGQPGDLKLDVASIIEFQYTPNGAWFYAPQMRVAETTGVGGVLVTSEFFSIPGFGRVPGCGVSQRVEPGQSLELFAETYGDYPLTFDKSGFRTPGPVGVVLNFIDDSGRRGSITVSLPITPGALPTTYSGGSGGGYPCRPGG